MEKLIPNTIFFSSLLKEEYPELAKQLEEAVHPIWLDGTLDIWLRDFMPIQIGKDTFVHYTYYPDYLLKYKTYRGKITNPIHIEQQYLIQKGKTVVNLPLVIDGGNVVMADDIMFMTDKVFQENKLSENEEESRAAIKNILQETFGLKPEFARWVTCEEFGHTDWVVRYVGGDNNTIIVGFNETKTEDLSKDISDILEHINSRQKERFNIEKYKLDNRNEKKSWAYLNYVQVGNKILMPTVGDPENDKEAIAKLQDIFIKAGLHMEIIPIDCEELIRRGGALHCISWNPQL